MAVELTWIRRDSSIHYYSKDETMLFAIATYDLESRGFYLEFQKDVHLPTGICPSITTLSTQAAEYIVLGVAEYHTNHDVFLAQKHALAVAEDLESRLQSDIDIATENRGILDLKPGDIIIDEEGDEAVFESYGPRSPTYVNLRYAFAAHIVRLPNAGLKRKK